MPSPFPGMDPYLEGYLWPDVHHALATELRNRLGPLLWPRYVARLEVYLVGDKVPGHELGIVFPDVEVIRPRSQSPGGQMPGEGTLTVAPVTPAPLTIPVTLPLEVQLVSVQIRDTAGNELVTSIEILSPTNKREPGLAAYRLKRDELRFAGVHLLEIDLIRRGVRPWSGEKVPAAPYMAMLTRRRRAQAEVWPIGLHEALPVLPAPLRYPDPDVPLDLPGALAAIYDEANYSLTLDYNSPPPEPPLSEADAAWADDVLRRAGWREAG